MRLSTAVTLALTALLVTSTLGVVVATADSAPAPEAQPAASVGITTADEQPSLTSSSPHVSGTSYAAQSASEPLSPADPAQVIRINISDDGDARWTVESRYLLTDDEDEALFDEYAAAVARGERDAGYDEAQFEPFVESAAEATGREMAIEDAGWNEHRIEAPDEDDADLEEDDRIGVISYSFTWTNFATAANDRIYFGDALDPSAGVGMTLDGNQRLVVESPPNYALDTPTPLSWDGPHEFEEGELEIVFVRGHVGSSIAPSALWLGGGAILLIIGGFVLYRYLGRSSDGDRSLPFPTTSTAEPSAESRTESTESHLETPPDPVPEHEAGTSVEFEEELEDDVDLELLSDEERVHRLLRQNGGRMKQANIVKETGWSNAKVSQLLSQMDDDDEIDKLRIGRENLITLPEVDPTEVD
ncbi:helix-turn-helix transcriptional regulator [Natrarchaeobius oligotrophus]|uniref:Transmembrane glycoprotein / HTH domain protein n=1 Tax=Natrarchaeobius chitinivorans TaxID=1679083 RepID=A0A3N6M0E1_NATCH|nr:hypothetical protein [Natrarchaeobius chitinivorans]RQG96703.1 hypothetical protein EA472_20330 [Natrarchaeobius chitinivorans]